MTNIVDVQGSLTPGLLDLMEDEKSIEQAVTAMLDMASAWERIRDRTKYTAAGYTSFASYCKDRWGTSESRVSRIISAGAVVRDLPIGKGLPVPAHESQVRPLKALPTPEDRAAAWEEAVEEAGGEQPTARQVATAVQRRQPPKRDHPAPFSDDILDTVAEGVRGLDTVFDPFAGTGRVHELRERADVRHTIGVEIEPEWADKHEDTILGSALDVPLPDASVDAVVTSPTYGNRMADHHDAKDDSTRLTYKHTLGRDLHEDNSGQMQWGDEYREFHRKAWAEAVRVLRPDGPMIINVKDHIRSGVQQHVVAWHIDTLIREFGLALEALEIIPTRGLMAGANADTRTCAEVILTFRKPT